MLPSARLHNIFVVARVGGGGVGYFVMKGVIVHCSRIEARALLNLFLNTSRMTLHSSS